MVTFVYLAHSQERFRKQTAFSILSLLEYLVGSDFKCRIAVYTDEPDFFKRLEVETVPVNEELLKDWKGQIDFVHRSKICVMLDAAERFSGKLMFVDSDNCLFCNPVDFLKNWSDDTVIMEKLEYVLNSPADRVGEKYKRFFKNTNKFAGYDVGMNQNCWNSGIIGLPEMAQKKLPDVLKVCDEMHEKFNKHLSEQMAFSIVMSKHFKVKSFKDYTYHWFGHGQAINVIVERVLEDYERQNLNDLIVKVTAVKEEVRNAPLNRNKLPWYKRWFSS
jgi:hypothetical protein